MKKLLGMVAIMSGLGAEAGVSTQLVQEVADRLTGTLNSADQSLENLSYFDVTVRSCSVRWLAGINTQSRQNVEQKTLYLEQAISLNLQAPYRVRLVRIFQEPGSDVVQVANYALENDQAYLGLCDRPAGERIISGGVISEAVCTFQLRRDGDSFVGGTPAGGCPNNSRGASYVTTEIRLGPDTMESWDRGWNDAGEQVWGASEGPYVFRKVDPRLQDAEIVDLGSMIVGESNNFEQVEQDPANFSPVEYQICAIQMQRPIVQKPYRLFYAEQKIRTPERELVRQSIYQWARNNDNLELVAHKVTDPEFFRGLCKKSASQRRNLDVDKIAWNGDCFVDYVRSGRSEYRGQTRPGGCPSNFRGASYLVIDEIISPGKIAVWERWYNANDEQVAGSTAGPYIYRRTQRP